jgi:uncharacterized protein YndB with AHSA1/START domain
MKSFGFLAAMVLLGFGAVHLTVFGLESYGLALFFAIPLMMGLLIGWWTRRNVAASSFLRAFGLLLLALVGLGMLLLAVGHEGAICLIIALVPASVAGLVGLALGYGFGQGPASRTSAAALFLFPVLPALSVVPGTHVLESWSGAAPEIREVRTSVLIDAPIERVWDVVIAFPRITAEPDWISRLGVAYPIEARIEGEGVGAVRHCVFSTGNFVEPITRWEPPRLLAFDVEACPPPMKELSFHDHVNAPHLNGHFVSHRGQFRLVEHLDGTVLLEGTTWYSHDVAPEWYWGPISDHLIHRIHRRVLSHIAQVAVSH